MEIIMKLLSFGEVLFDIDGRDACIGGAPLNLAAHLTLQGWETCIVSAVGDDELGKRAISEIEKIGIGTSYINILPDRETGKCIVTLDENSVPTYDLLTDMAYDHIKYPKLDGKFDILAFGTLALRMEPNTEVIKRIIQSNSFAEIYTDLNIRMPFCCERNILFCLENATILKISDEELPYVSEAVFGKSYACGEICPLFSDKFPQLKIIIITAGDKGAYAYICGDKRLCFCEAERVNVVSTVGAGDSFGAAFLAKYFTGADIQACLEFASGISAFVVSNKGAIPDGMKEYIRDYIKK